jgi:hypothetical protein
MKGMSYADEFLPGGADTSGAYGGVGRDKFLRIVLDLGPWQFVHSFETVAKCIRELHEIGIESISMCFFDPLGGLQHMEDAILPIMKCM